MSQGTSSNKARQNFAGNVTHPAVSDHSVPGTVNTNSTKIPSVASQSVVNTNVAKTSSVAYSHPVASECVDNESVPHIPVVVTPCKRKSSQNILAVTDPRAAVPDSAIKNPYVKPSSSSTTSTVSMRTSMGENKKKKKKFTRECRFHVRLTRGNVEIIGCDIWPNGGTDAFLQDPIIYDLTFPAEQWCTDNGLMASMYRRINLERNQPQLNLTGKLKQKDKTHFERKYLVRAVDCSTSETRKEFVNLLVDVRTK